MPNSASSPTAVDLSAALKQVAADLASAARDADLSGRPSIEAVNLIRGSGVPGAAIPREYGGLGYDADSLNRVIEELAQIDGSLAIVIYQHFAVSSRITEWGNPELKAATLPRLAAGEWLAASAWSEAGAGAAKQQLATTAVRPPGGGWTLDGAKTFVTGAELAGVLLVLATTSRPNDPSAAYGAAGQSFFVVETNTPGLECHSGPDLVGMRGSATGLVSLTACHVHDDALLGRLGEATRIIAGVRNHGMTLGAVAVGIAQRAYEIVCTDLERRNQLTHQAFRHRLVGISTRIEAARALVASAGRRDRDDPGTVTLQSKIFATETAQTVLAECADLLGSAAFVCGHPINQLTRDVRAVGLMGPTNELCRELISARWTT